MTLLDGLNLGSNLRLPSLSIVDNIVELYPGSVGAYALRQVSGAYSGILGTIERDSDNATLDVGMIDGEIDITAAETFTGANTASWITWKDQSGAGRDLTEDAATAPKLIVSGTTQLKGGEPTLYFDGTTFLRRPDSLGLSGDPGLYVAWVCEAVPVSGDHIWGIGASSASPSGKRISMEVETTTQSRTRHGNGAGTFAVAQNTFALYGYTRAASDGHGDAFMRKSGSSVAGGSSPGTVDFADENFRVGTGILSTPCECYMSEIIVWSGPQTANIAGIETLINDFYGF